MKLKTDRILLLALIWTAVGVFLAAPAILSGGSWGEVVGKLVDSWFWGLLTPLILAIDHRLPFSDKQLGLRLAMHLPLSVLFSALHIYGTAIILLPDSAISWNPIRSSQYFPSWFLGAWVMYCAIFGALQALKYHARFLSSELDKERLQRGLLEAHLNTLRAQLDPHFLFNALNTISSGLERNPAQARAMIENLGILLRLSLESKDQQEIALAEELAFLERYFAIQRIRFGDRLSIEMRVSPEVKNAYVPCFLIQPLAENAIRHGLSGRSSGGVLTIVAESIGDRLVIRVLDNGVGLPPGWNIETCGGLGLSITKERVIGLYPAGQSRFEVRRSSDQGTEVEITLPLRMAGDGAHELDIA